MKWFSVWTAGISSPSHSRPDWQDEVAARPPWLNRWKVRGRQKTKLCGRLSTGHFSSRLQPSGSLSRRDAPECDVASSDNVKMHIKKCRSGSVPSCPAQTKEKEKKKRGHVLRCKVLALITVTPHVPDSAVDAAPTAFQPNDAAADEPEFD